MYPLKSKLSIRTGKNESWGELVYSPGKTFIGINFITIDRNAKTMRAMANLYSEEGEIVNSLQSGQLEINNHGITVNGNRYDLSGNVLKDDQQSETGAYDLLFKEFFPEITEAGLLFIKKINIAGKTVGDYI